MNLSTACRESPSSVEAVDDIDAEVRTCRDHVADYLNRGESHYDPASASELATDRPDEYIFLFNYVEDVTALVGNCQVTIMPSLQQIKRIDHDYPDLELADFVDAALEIGRTSLLALRRRLPTARVPREMDPHWLDGVSDSAAGRIGVSAVWA